jgi:hypothetical protein
LSDTQKLQSTTGAFTHPEKLDGEFFDNARMRVNEVTEQYPAKDLADLLLTMMAHQLQDMQKAVMEEGQTLLAQGKDIPADRLAHMEAIIEEVENGICDLITDPNFKQNLLKPGHCIFKLASRMSSGLKKEKKIMINMNFFRKISILSLSLTICPRVHAAILTILNYMSQTKWRRVPVQRACSMKLCIPR